MISVFMTLLVVPAVYAMWRTTQVPEDVAKMLGEAARRGAVRTG